MLKIIIEKETTQVRYQRLKDSLGSPTDSILIDMLIENYEHQPIEEPMDEVAARIADVVPASKRTNKKETQ